MENVTPEQIDVLRRLIDESVEILDDEEAVDYTETETGEEAAVDEEELGEEIECPECNGKFVLDMTGLTSGTINCPNCGAELELSFEKEGEEE
jgi:DNA-directed RNA polymerase subunit RPC12/RpoP